MGTMKKLAIAILFVACFAVQAAAQTPLKLIKDLPEGTAILSGDLLVTVSDPNGSNQTRKITFANFKASIFNMAMTLPDGWFPSVLPPISGVNLTHLPAANIEGSIPLTSIPLIGNNQIASNAAIDWSKINKSFSSLADIATRSASDLNSGTVPLARLPAMVGDSGSGGTAGIVPAPAAGDAAAGKFLKANGLWAAPPGAAISSVFSRTGAITAQNNDYTWAQINKTTSSLADITTRSASDLSSGTVPVPRLPAMVGDSGSGGTAGIAPAPGAGDAAAKKFLRADATYAVPPTMTGDAGSGGSVGYVPAPAAGDAAAGKFLKANGQWAVPPGGGGSPGGSGTEVQYRGGASTFSAAANFDIKNNNPHLIASAQPGSPNDGEFWNDSTRKTQVAYTAGLTVFRGGMIFVSTADQSVSNTTAETTLLGSGVGSHTLPANFLTPGRTLRITIRGVFGTQNASQALGTITLKYGSTPLYSTTYQPIGPSDLAASSVPFEIVAIVTCRTTGASGSAMGTVYSSWTNNTATLAMTQFGGTAGFPSATTINTTTSNALDLTFTWITANGSNFVIVTQAIVEALN